MEMFGTNVRGDVAVTGLLELLGYPYTGGGPGELSLRQDKGLAKRALAFEKILYPDFAVISRDDLETGGNLHMPLFVKPLRADASIGIGGDSLVHDTMTLMKRVASIHKKFNDTAIAEEYIEEPRVLHVGVLGNNSPVAFPPIEMDFSGLPPGIPRVAGSARPSGRRTASNTRARNPVVADIPDDLRELPGCTRSPSKRIGRSASGITAESTFATPRRGRST